MVSTAQLPEDINMAAEQQLEHSDSSDETFRASLSMQCDEKDGDDSDMATETSSKNIKFKNEPDVDVATCNTADVGFSDCSVSDKPHRGVDPPHETCDSVGDDQTSMDMSHDNVFPNEIRGTSVQCDAESADANSSKTSKESGSKEVGQTADSSFKCDRGVTNSSRTWMSPDGAFSKCILKAGRGFTAPNDGARCRVTLSVPTQYQVKISHENLQRELGYPLGVVDIVLGNGCGKFSEMIDACLETMHQGEECELNILDKDVNRDKSWQEKFDKIEQSEFAGSDDKYVLAVVHVTLHSFTRNKDIFEMSVADILVRAKELKEFGTQCFKDGQQNIAEQFYIRALRYLISVCHPKDVPKLEDNEKQEFVALKRTCSLNLAACQLKCKRYQDVIVHCGQALEDDPSNTKALYRRCQAYLALDEFESARADIETALVGDPKNKAFLDQQRLLIKREKQVYNKLSLAMNKMFGGSS